jgi:hypothetical protein
MWLRRDPAQGQGEEMIFKEDLTKYQWKPYFTWLPVWNYVRIGKYLQTQVYWLEWIWRRRDDIDDCWEYTAEDPNG